MDTMTGALLYYNVKKNPQICRLPAKLLKAVSLCDNPYKLGHFGRSSEQKVNWLVIIAARIIVPIVKFSFWISYKIISGWIPLYDDAKQAIEAFYRIYPVDRQDSLCLPRALFAAAMSKKFRKNGVVFIGVFLPSKSMHAWIIEDGIQPDVNDNIWINFKPVAAIC